jgi:hypothetical protein
MKVKNLFEDEQNSKRKEVEELYKQIQQLDSAIEDAMDSCSSQSLSTTSATFQKRQDYEIKLRQQRTILKDKLEKLKKENKK